MEWIKSPKTATLCRWNKNAMYTPNPTIPVVAKTYKREESLLVEPLLSKN